MIMMQRPIHLTPAWFLERFKIKPDAVAQVCLVSGERARVQEAISRLDSPVKIFAFAGISCWTGRYKGKPVSVSLAGAYAPDSAFATEILCACGCRTLIRLSSCGALLEDIAIGDIIIATQALRGEGVTQYYLEKGMTPCSFGPLAVAMAQFLKDKAKVHSGKVWTTDAVLRETRTIVNEQIGLGAIGVDMEAAAFLAVAGVCRAKAVSVLAVSDNLITGEMGFLDRRFRDAEIKMIEAGLDVLTA